MTSQGVACTTTPIFTMLMLMLGGAFVFRLGRHAGGTAINAGVVWIEFMIKKRARELLDLGADPLAEQGNINLGLIFSGL